MVCEQAAFNISKDKFEGILFDLDGVVTKTAKVHATSSHNITLLNLLTFDGYSTFGVGYLIEVAKQTCDITVFPKSVLAFPTAI
jgi:hypothetical protein